MLLITVAAGRNTVEKQLHEMCFYFNIHLRHSWYPDENRKY